MANTVKEISIKQHDGNYQTKDVGVSYTNVEGLSTEAIAFKSLNADKATTDKNNKDITTYIASISKNGSKIRTTNGAGDNLDIGFTMTGASSSTDGVGGFVPTPTKGNQDKFLKGDGTWGVPQDTTYTGSSNIDISSSNVIDLKNTTITANTYGPTADVTGSNGATIKIPKFTVDAKGRLTSAGTQTFTAVNTTYSAGTGLSLSGTTFSLGSHASGGTGYGIGTGSNYGHVKLSDTYSSKVSGGAAANGMAASQNALYNAYNTLNTNFSSALTDLKATAIAQAVGATGTTFTSVIATLGTIIDQGKKTQTLSASTTSYTIPAGYHNGQGSVSVTKGTAKVGTEDRTWSNNGTVSLNCGQSLSVGAGVYYTGTITANSLASQTTVDSGKTAVTAATMLTGYQGWVNGNKITGTMPYQDGQNKVLDTSTTSYTIPVGYHNGNGKVSITTETKTQAAGTSAIDVTPSTGKVLSKVTINPTPSQVKQATPSIDIVDVTPDSGKLLSKVSIDAITSPGRNSTIKWADNTLKVVEGSLGSRGACTDGTIRSVFELPSGWYGSHDNTRDLLGITDDKMRQLGWEIKTDIEGIYGMDIVRFHHLDSDGQNWEVDKVRRDGNNLTLTWGNGFYGTKTESTDFATYSIDTANQKVLVTLKVRCKVLSYLNTGYYPAGTSLWTNHSKPNLEYYGETLSVIIPY